MLGTVFKPFRVLCNILETVRRYLNYKHKAIKVFLKLDFKNAFNELERNPMLLAALTICPEIFPYVKQCYATPSVLWFGDFEIMSQRGCQQGDPCGPPLFCMAMRDMTHVLKSELNIWYLDDGWLGGDPEVVLEDLKTIISKATELGLQLNFDRCELKILGNDFNHEIYNKLNEIAPGITLKEGEKTLLGAPLTNDGISGEIRAKMNKLNLMVDRLKKMNSHQSFFLLRNSLLIPKLTYLLRSTPCWRSINDLQDYNNIIKSAIKDIINCSLNEEAWKKFLLTTVALVSETSQNSVTPVSWDRYTQLLT